MAELQKPPSAWLLDGNVLTALSLAEHAHHDRALRWFDSQSIPFATCSTTQGTLLRLHIQLSAHPSPAAAWACLRALASHPSHLFWDDGFSFLDIEPAGLSGHRQVTDAWLAHLARRRRGRVATLDAAFADTYPDVATLIPPSPET